MTERETSGRTGGEKSSPHPNAISIALLFGSDLHCKIVLDVVGSRYPKHPSQIP